MKMSKITLVVASNLVSTIAGLLVDKAASFSVEDAGSLSMRKQNRNGKKRGGSGPTAASEILKLFSENSKKEFKFNDQRIVDILIKNGMSATSASPVLSALRREGKIETKRRGTYKIAEAK